MTINQALISAIQQIKTQTASLDAEVLLSFVLKKPKEFLFTNPKKNLTLSQEKKFTDLIKRRRQYEPIAYLIGEKEFFGLKFFVTNKVLIPRTETEMLVEEILKIDNNQRLTIADIGTGSGCIAITLAKQLTANKIYAVDVSKPTLKLARKNNHFHKTKVKFHQGNLITPIKNKKVDLIVANLPYGSKKIWKNLSIEQKNSLSYEPKIALYAGHFGLAKYEELFDQIRAYKLTPRFILIEIDPAQTSMIKKIIRQKLPQAKIEIKKDLAKLDRICIVKLN